MWTVFFYNRYNKKKQYGVFNFCQIKILIGMLERCGRLVAIRRKQKQIIMTEY